MHTGTSAVHSKRVGKSRELGDDGQPAFCGCGCGAKLVRNSAGRMPKYLHGHSGRKSQEQWAESHRRYVESAPLCACGCGQQVGSVNQTLERFIRREGQLRHPRFITGHASRKFDSQLVITERQRRLLVAAAYGDGSIQRPHAQSKHIRLVIRHSTKQIGWLEHKASQFPGFGMSISITPNGGYGDHIASAVTWCLPQLDFLLPLCTASGKKRVTKEGLELLDDEAFSWWFADDGSSTSSSGSSGMLHIEGCSHDEQDLIRDWFKARYGDCSLFEYRGYRCLYIKRDAYRFMCERLRQFVIPSMQYKMGTHRLN